MNDFRDFLSGFDVDALASTVSSRFYDDLKQCDKYYVGSDGVSSRYFNEHKEQMVASTIRKMLSDGRAKSGSVGSLSRFTFTPFKRFGIEKIGGKKGEERQISAASISSIIAQIPIANYLQSRLEPVFSDASYGYRPGRSAKQAIRVVHNAILKQNYWIFDADIEKFFDSVDHEVVLNSIQEYFPGDQFLALILTRFLKTGHVRFSSTRRYSNIRRKSGGYVTKK